ncbi:hypothetical protein llg_36140 [Luteolibacter sp. LG18]|nr:hypothetical protein llg_36140 [Luteolibacter sp. LG18]
MSQPESADVVVCCGRSGKREALAKGRLSLDCGFFSSTGTVVFPPVTDSAEYQWLASVLPRAEYLLSSERYYVCEFQSMYPEIAGVPPIAVFKMTSSADRDSVEIEGWDDLDI